MNYYHTGLATSAGSRQPVKSGELSGLPAVGVGLAALFLLIPLTLIGGLALASLGGKKS